MNNEMGGRKKGLQEILCDFFLRQLHKKNLLNWQFCVWNQEFKSCHSDIELLWKVCQIILDVEKWIWRKWLPRDTDMDMDMDMVRLFGEVGNLISVCMVCFGAPGAPGAPVGRVAPPRPRDSSKSSRACASRVTAWVIVLVFWDDICSWWTKRGWGVKKWLQGPGLASPLLPFLPPAWTSPEEPSSPPPPHKDLCAWSWFLILSPSPGSLILLTSPSSLILLLLPITVTPRHYWHSCCYLLSANANGGRGGGFIFIMIAA